MSAEPIYKLQPHRTLQLRGCDDRGAAAALHSASASAFTVSGRWGDGADVCVLELFNADNYFEHPRLKYLPDFNFTNMILAWTESRTNLQPLDSDWYPTVAWPYLDIIYADSSTAQLPLIDYATPATGSYTQASVEFELQGTPTTNDYITVAWLDEHHTHQLYYTDTLETAVQALVDSVNAFSSTMQATRTGARIRLTLLDAGGKGANGNRVGVYTLVAGAKTETWSPDYNLCSGGVSPSSWTISIPLPSTPIRQMWLTLAPAIQAGDFQASEWVYEVTDWSVTDPDSHRALKVAGPASVRIEENSSACTYSGSSWARQSSFYSRGYATRATAANDSVTIVYYSGAVHDLYLGTSLYSGRGKFAVHLDGDSETELDCALSTDAPIITRRRLRASVPAGKHTLLLTAKSASPVYFDFIEAAVLSDVPDAPAICTAEMAIDWDTDHSYKLPPARLLWALDRLGFTGDLNHYAGVFFWNQRIRVGGDVQVTTVTFSGTPDFSETISLLFSALQIDHLCLMGETAESVALAFELLINHGSTVFWASRVGAVLTLRGRSTGKYWRTEVTGTPSEHVTCENTNLWYTTGQWQIDPTVTPILNRAARDWHADFYSLCHAASRNVWTALSMEQFNTPSSWPARFPDGVKVLTATGFGVESPSAVADATNASPIVIECPNHDYDTGDSITIVGVLGNTAANGTRLITKIDADHYSLDGSTGNGAYASGGDACRNLRTSHCSFVDAVQAYQTDAFTEFAQLQIDAGLSARLQFGEFCWWYFARAGSGIACYDDEVKADALADLGRDLYVFTSPTDDPSVNGYVDAIWLRNRLRDHVAAIKAAVSATWEILWPYDVNYPTQLLTRFINLPTEWQAKIFDRFKIEGLAFGVVERNLNKVREAVRFPFTSPCTWPKADVVYLLPWFESGTPWQREFLLAGRELIGQRALWAWDHLNLFNWPLPMPTETRRSTFRAA